jgi:hypothetical protein
MVNVWNLIKNYIKKPKKTIDLSNIPSCNKGIVISMMRINDK